MFDLGRAGISVGTLSKPFGLPGLRIGWMAAPREIVERCWAMRDYVSLSPGKPNDALGILAIRNRDKIVERNRGIIGTNLAAADAWVREHAGILSWKPPRGGLLAMLRFELGIPSLELADKLAEEYSVMLAPGSVFGYEPYLRLGIGQHPGVFAAALAQASACFAELTS